MIVDHSTYVLLKIKIQDIIHHFSVVLKKGQTYKEYDVQSVEYGRYIANCIKLF